MNSGSSPYHDEFAFSLHKIVIKRIERNPEILALFLGLAVALSWFREYIIPDWGQLIAFISQLAPRLFEQQHVFRPRTPLDIAVAIAVGVAICWTFALACVTTIYRVGSPNDTQSLTFTEDLRRGVTMSLRALAFIFVALMAAVVGLIGLIVPGVIIVIRLFLGLPVLILQDRSISAAAVESWRLSAGYEVVIGLCVGVLVAGGAMLWEVPVVGPAIAFIVVSATGVTASVALYDATRESPRLQVR